MESLLPQFNTISLIHPMSSATSHLLEQRQFLSTQPLVIEFEGFKSFIRDKKLISISNTMKNNMFHCLIK
ncbi:hypothetical protein ACTFIZ_005853 [Dictyostelium cf. discoideum]